MTSSDDQGEYIIEFVPIGNSVKVSAMDPVSLTEVSIVGPVTASKLELQQTAVKKLLYVMRKASGADQEKTSPSSDGRGGIIV
ncbi:MULTISPECIES: DUF6898 family protein [Sneathiella]|jgi:hypothetical protein|uniref:DUF6898 family protein n=1 Tax=Sneathiella TaxID=510690 RepID=UPI0015E18AA5|nr:hypothetical protein [Sneathiella aquimaris]